MGRYRFELATRDDDAELRAVLAATPMDGQVSLSFRREPGFHAAVVEGDFHQAVVCRDLRAGRIAGFGCRSVRKRFVNGRPQAVGYLSGLRALPQYRSLGLIARGYAFFRELHGDGRAPYYLTTIADGNERALSALTAARAGLPTYRFTGIYHTVVIPIGRRRTRVAAPPANLEIRAATPSDRELVAEFLTAHGASRQFFPKYEANDLFRADGGLRGLASSDLMLAFREGRLAGTLGGWDQFAFKQSIVERYDALLHWNRPLLNAWARVRGRPPLPPAGAALRYLTAALPVVIDDDPAVFRALLSAVLEKAAGGPCDYLVVGLERRDPLLPVVRPLQSGCYLTRAYSVCWDEAELPPDSVEERTPYLELGAL